jgi:hypothetical protein
MILFVIGVFFYEYYIIYCLNMHKGRDDVDKGFIGRGSSYFGNGSDHSYLTYIFPFILPFILFAIFWIFVFSYSLDSTIGHIAPFERFWNAQPSPRKN